MIPPSAQRRGQRNGDKPGSAGLFHGGLTKRELLAAMAMQGMCANSEYFQTASYSNIAAVAVEMADALLAELANPLPWERS